MTPSTIEELKKKLAQLEVDLLENFETPEHWGTAELARHHAGRLGVARSYLLMPDLVGHQYRQRTPCWLAIARILDAEIFLREIGGKK